MAGLINLKVTPEVLKDRSHALSDSIDALCSDFLQLENLMSGTKSYWIGEAGEKYRRDYEDKKSTITKLENQLKDYPSTILKMAGIYEQAEEENRKTSEDLPDVTFVK